MLVRVREMLLQTTLGRGGTMYKSHFAEQTIAQP